MSNIFKLFLTLILVISLSACGQSRQEDIYIGIAWAKPKDNTNLFIPGAQLAVEEVNAIKASKRVDNIANYLDTRNLRLIYDHRGSGNVPSAAKQAMAGQIASSLSKYNNLIAVVGHRQSSMAVPAANLYQQYQKVFLAPTATSMKLTTFKFKFIFRMHPNNEEMGHQLAYYCYKKGYRNIAMIYDRSEYGRELSKAFRLEVFRINEQYNLKNKEKLEVVFRKSFFANEVVTSDGDLTKILVEIRNIKEKLKERPNRTANIDAIMMFSGRTFGMKIYKKAREQGFKAPFIVSDSLEVQEFWNLVREWENEDTKEKTVAPTIFNPTTNTPTLNNFIKNFSNKYNIKPDRMAALGYDAIMVLAHAMNSIKFDDESTLNSEPKEELINKISHNIADSLHYLMPTCKGVTGRFEYFDNGDMKNRILYMKSIKGTDYSYDTVYSSDYFSQMQERLTIPECNKSDSDKDGVFDFEDACPKNAPGEIEKGVYKDKQSGGKIGCPLDTDQDGIPDYKDNCPESPPGAVEAGLNKDGCGQDSDNDGTPDYADKCPQSSPEEMQAGADEHGCPLDTDGDQIPDYKDSCPRNTENELKLGVDNLGCPLDSDGDGNPDYWDKCPHNIPEELVGGVDAQGCPMDRDKDGRLDYLDRCPLNTEEELAAGIDTSGCPMDFDQDGIPDYKDKCPKNTPEELSAGINPQGCPFDSDKDGVGNYKDQCANSSQRWLMNEYGCPKFKRRALSLVGENYFIAGRAKLEDSAYQLLAAFLQTVEIDLIESMTITAYTDNIGDKSINLLLSHQRAQGVADYLAQQYDITRRKIKVIGRGEADPISPNDTAENRLQNRRIEIRIKLYQLKPVPQEKEESKKYRGGGKSGGYRKS